MRDAGDFDAIARHTDRVCDLLTSCCVSCVLLSDQDEDCDCGTWNVSETDTTTPCLQAAKRKPIEISGNLSVTREI